MHKNWYDKLNNKLRQKRQDEELRETLVEWGSAKARIS